MNPKEKAQELVNNMYQHQWRKDTIEFRNAKQCALIAVDELIYSHSQDTTDNQFYYWQEVKQEIQIL